jgi:hypothetical protein
MNMKINNPIYGRISDMKLSLLKTALLVTFILTTTALAQEQGLSFNFFGGGARSEGMGQAFLAISNDASAGGWNPAGLYVHEKTLMNFSYSYMMPKGEYTFYATPSLSKSYKHDATIGAINNWSIISPLRAKNHHFVLNLSYTRNFDAYYMFGERIIMPYTYFKAGADGSYIYLPFSLGYGDTLPNAQIDRRGGLNNINFAFGTRLYDKLSFGFSANIYNGRMVTEELRDLGMSYVYQGETYSANSQITLIDTTRYSGFNMTIGLLYAAEKFRAGLAIRTPFNLKGESDSTIYRITTMNNVADAEFTDTVYVDNMTSRIEVPLILGLGIGYNLSEDMLVAADVDIRNFSGKYVKNLDSVLLTAGGERIEFYHNNDYDWSNIIQFRFGMEYLLHPAFGTVPLRIGFRNEAFPYGNISNYEIKYEGEKGATVNDSSRISYVFEYDDEIISGYSVSVGTGVHWSQIQLDVAYTYSTFEQNIYLENAQRSKNEWKNHHLNFTFTGYF